TGVQTCALPIWGGAEPQPVGHGVVATHDRTAAPADDVVAGVGGVAGTLVDDPRMHGEIAAPAIGGGGIDLNDRGVGKAYRVGGDAGRMTCGGAPTARFARLDRARVVGQAQSHG